MALQYWAVKSDVAQARHLIELNFGTDYYHLQEIEKEECTIVRIAKESNSFGGFQAETDIANLTGATARLEIDIKNLERMAAESDSEAERAQYESLIVSAGEKLGEMNSQLEKAKSVISEQRTEYFDFVLRKGRLILANS